MRNSAEIFRLQGTMWSTLSARILGRFKFRTNLYRLNILVSENCEDIYKALNFLIESIEMTENLSPKISRQKYYRPKILAGNVYQKRISFVIQTRQNCYTIPFCCQISITVL